MRRLIAPTLALAFLVPVAACGGGAAPTPAPPPPPAPATADAAEEAPSPTAAAAADVDPCALVTKAEAEKLAGTPLEDGVPVRETCTYSGPVTGPTAQVEVYVGDGAKKMLDIDRDLGHAFEEVSGAGDEAYVEDGAVFVNKGGTWVAIRLVRLDDPAKYREPLADVARTVAGRL